MSELFQNQDIDAVIYFQVTKPNPKPVFTLAQSCKGIVQAWEDVEINILRHSSFWLCFQSRR
jgi:hypothetical protein